MLTQVYAEIDFTPGPLPGQLTARVRYRTPEGTVIYTSDPTPVGVGQTLHAGPVSIEFIQVIQARPTQPAAQGVTAAQAVAGLKATGS